MPRDTSAAAPDHALPFQQLSQALLESRERWRAMALLANEFAFEADPAGRICFIAPAGALGYPDGSLLGSHGSSLLANGGGGMLYDPFLPARPEMRGRVWLRHGGGGVRCYAVAVRQFPGAGGAPAGVRGVAQDITAQNDHDAQVAGALRRGELLEHIMWRMRQEVMAPRMMSVILEALMNALGAGGAVLTGAPQDHPDEILLHTVGTTPTSVLACAAALPAADVLEMNGDPAPRIVASAENHSVLLCPTNTRYGKLVTLMLWRDHDGRPWDSEDRLLTSSISAVIGVVLEHEAIQREMARQARTDPLTGLLNRRSFFEAVERRIARSERDGLSTVLMYVDLDHFKWINDVWGHEAGDDALCRFSALLQSIFRPTDLVARLGGDEFAVWMDGIDQFTAAERAERLGHEAKSIFRRFGNGQQPELGASIGMACRAANSGEGIDSLMRRADLAMYEIKRGGRGRWLVSRDEPIG